ncbi:MAG: putative methyltransferase [Acidimicrobiales bacterium]|nr:putative methyltransferase [Acidimicrobiales bacterium]
MTRDDDQRFLRRKTRPDAATGGTVAAVDLFAGCGGLSVGLWEAARRQGKVLSVPLAVDVNPVMASTFRRNIPASRALASRVEELFPGDPGSKLTNLEVRIARSVGPIQVLLGGPPCQGHSDLNNHTRRKDDRNRLYLRMARAAEVLRPQAVLVENVPAVQWDAGKVVDDTIAQLEKLGYRVKAQVVDLSLLGVPQRRRRHLTIATLGPLPDPTSVFAHIERLAVEHDVSWALGDLDVASNGGLFDTSSTPTQVSRDRMNYLFDNQLYELPDSQRPPCHRDKAHSYRSVYGRMGWNSVAPTITTGFGSMGQGRFVHPLERRTITPHEAARLQTFPDWFNWGTQVKRGQLATMIGNAVPPLLMIRLGEYLLAGPEQG